jgi:hypothetical protein
MHCPPCPACSLISSIQALCMEDSVRNSIQLWEFGMSQKVRIHETAVSRSLYHFITYTYSILHTKVVSKNFVIILSNVLVLESYSRSLDDHATK